MIACISVFLRSLMDLDRGLSPEPSSDESLCGIGVVCWVSLLDSGIEGVRAYGVTPIIKLSFKFIYPIVGSLGVLLPVMIIGVYVEPSA